VITREMDIPVLGHKWHWYILVGRSLLLSLLASTRNIGLAWQFSEQNHWPQGINIAVIISSLISPFLINAYYFNSFVKMVCNGWQLNEVKRPKSILVCKSSFAVIKVIFLIEIKNNSLR